MRKKGFTLIELILAIVIIGFVITGLALTYQQIIQGLIYNSELNKVTNIQQQVFSLANSFHYEDPAIAVPTTILEQNYLNSGYKVRIDIGYKFISASYHDLYNVKVFRVRIFKKGTSQVITDTRMLRLGKLKYVTF
ncbi:hypothetical protein A2291_06910 [candidate division WOR-1 bacterium RIFOXYB2_FULL_42_35]|uniref:Prepilin-type N-terminal cleavage/methylation domain-containing protein n=1 Tax=candidate division WOR-1 bacterium RIFOXYC2_FULL_41_25 TaxID=1802586 RepID=A0A1F4TPK6_UNCSA|nr:MAG: hypothetical protein A2291_06910 [candidate division WOR-1 bacterium RIFOXYB2_FULL_42_35]OGC24608.1 MAG: hypothetical protein A2247_06690 [candidate division WOR-1 bacterium RIFOXYA2_FULL_41_14]OGC34654.1 MAG: hypothetical protein A2462_04925 [candidate division WOR-1 bacterium RIFOXYC2_FULL_41_25]OGC41603.1 MAG: hypothetical protein A2548_01245 [candidate division WOR-1 bacterium RIFOXYD2_FULL_41_8]